MGRLSIRSDNFLPIYVYKSFDELVEPSSPGLKNSDLVTVVFVSLPLILDRTTTAITPNKTIAHHARSYLLVRQANI